MQEKPLLRLTVTAEFPRADIHAHRFDLRSKVSGESEGVAVVCADARYASVRWRGAERLSRLHAPPSAWKTVEPLLRALALGDAAPPAVATLIAPERQLVVVCISAHTISAAPFDVTAALDGLLT